MPTYFFQGFVTSHRLHLQTGVLDFLIFGFRCFLSYCHRNIKSKHLAVLLNSSVVVLQDAAAAGTSQIMNFLSAQPESSRPHTVTEWAKTPKHQHSEC